MNRIMPRLPQLNLQPQQGGLSSPFQTAMQKPATFGGGTGDSNPFAKGLTSVALGGDVGAAKGPGGGVSTPGALKGIGGGDGPTGLGKVNNPRFEGMGDMSFASIDRSAGNIRPVNQGGAGFDGGLRGANFDMMG